MTRRTDCLGKRTEDRRPVAGLFRQEAEGQRHGRGSRGAILHRDQIHEEVTVPGLAVREQCSRIDGAAPGVLDGELVALQQFGQRVGCGPRFLRDLQPIAHAVRRGRRQAALCHDEPDVLRQRRAQALGHDLGVEVLV